MSTSEDFSDAAPFRGEHADMHRSQVALQFVTFIDAGIPRWMTETGDHFGRTGAPDGR